MKNTIYLVYLCLFSLILSCGALENKNDEQNPRKESKDQADLPAPESEKKKGGESTKKPQDVPTSIDRDLSPLASFKIPGHLTVKNGVGQIDSKSPFSNALECQASFVLNSGSSDEKVELIDNILLFPKDLENPSVEISDKLKDTLEGKVKKLKLYCFGATTQTILPADVCGENKKTHDQSCRASDTGKYVFQTAENYTLGTCKC